MEGRLVKTEIDPRFVEGVRLFNERSFFEAHEIWEQVWRIAEGDKRTFYQGLIQGAAALHHVRRRNYAGAIALYLKSRPKLERFPAVWMGIEVRQFCSDLATYFDALPAIIRKCGEDTRQEKAPAISGAKRYPVIKQVPRQS